jgi:hypothetical protein
VTDPDEPRPKPDAFTYSSTHILLRQPAREFLLDELSRIPGISSRSIAVLLSAN